MKITFYQKHIFTVNINFKFLFQVNLSTILKCKINNILDDENYVPIIGAFTKKINKPVALVKASRNLFGDAMGGLQKTASSIWNFGKDEGTEKRKKKKKDKKK